LRGLARGGYGASCSIRAFAGAADKAQADRGANACRSHLRHRPSRAVRDPERRDVATVPAALRDMPRCATAFACGGSSHVRGRSPGN